MNLLVSSKKFAQALRRRFWGKATSKVVLSSTRFTLELLKETLEGCPVPGLKGAIRGLLVIINTVEAVKQNAEDFLELTSHFNNLNDILTEYKDANWDDLPLRLKRAIDELAEGLEIIVAEVLDTASHGLARRVIDNTEDAQAFVRYIRRIDQLFKRFETVRAMTQDKQMAQLTKTTTSHAQQSILARLSRAEGVSWNCHQREFAPVCLEDTRIALRKKIMEWISDANGPPVFWLNGLAGTGKSTIAQSIAKSCAEQSYLASSFFFSRDQVLRHPPDLVFPTIALDLCAFDERFEPYLAQALVADPQLSSANLQLQFSKLFSGPLKQLKDEVEGDFKFPLVVVIDAVDECHPKDKASRILSHILSHSAGDSGASLVKFFITSRPEQHICRAFKEFSDERTRQCFVLHEIERQVVQSDIHKYLESGFRDVRRRRYDFFEPHEPVWPEGWQMNKLVEKSAGLFIYASTMLKFIDDEDENPKRRLAQMLDVNRDADSTAYTGLDQLYRQILSTCPSTARARSIIATVLLVVEPLPANEIEILSQIEEKEARVLLPRLQSVLITSTSSDQPIRIFHPSFYDFLTSEARSEELYINPRIHHARLASVCMTMIQNYSHTDPSALTPDTAQYRALKYACRFWGHHLEKTDPQDAALLEVWARFLTTSVDFLFDLMSQMGILYELHLTACKSYYWLKAHPSMSHDLLTLLCRQLHRIGVRYRLLFECTWDRLAVHHAWLAQIMAVEFLPEHIRPASYYRQIGITKRLRTLWNWNMADLPESIEAHRNAIKNIADSDDRAPFLVELAIALRIRGGPEDIGESLELLENALADITLGHINEAPCLNSFGITLTTRYEQCRDKDDLDRAISLHCRAVDCIRTGQAAKSVYLNHLALCLKTRFEHYGDVDDIVRALALFQESADTQSAAPSVRFEAAANYAHSLKLLDCQSVLAAYQAALDKVVLVSLPALRRDTAAKVLQEAQTCAYEGAASAIAEGNTQKAIEFVERGCRIFWLDGFELYQSLDPSNDLAKQTKQMASIFERHSSSEPITLLPETSPVTLRCIEEGQRYSVTEYEQKMVELHNQGIYASLKPFGVLDGMLSSLPRGLVIIINGAKSRCDAIIIKRHTTTEVFTVRLPITYSEAVTLHEQTKNAWTTKPYMGILVDCVDILQAIWLLIVLPIVSAVGLKPTSNINPPRIWWCLTGPFINLPLHAAGNYQQEPSVFLTDFAISSYIPTLHTLMRDPLPPRYDNNILFVDTDPKSRYERSTRVELAMMKDLLSDFKLLTFEGTSVDPNAVIDSLALCSGFHIAGRVNQRCSPYDNPVECAIVLRGGLQISLPRLMQVDVPRFAFLSSYPSLDSLQRPVNRIPFDFLLASFTSIVAAQFELTPYDAAQMSAAFYSEIVQSETDINHAAWALHRAMVKLRSEGVPARSWAKYIHIGL